MLVEVYWNLHKKVFSVRDPRSRLVIAHKESLVLKNVSFKVSEAGRKRVLRERRKNVHALVVGELLDCQPSDMAGTGSWNRIVYNPYKFDSFVDMDTHERIEQAPLAVLTGNSVYVPRTSKGL